MTTSSYNIANKSLVGFANEQKGGSQSLTDQWPNYSGIICT